MEPRKRCRGRRATGLLARSPTWPTCAASCMRGVRWRWRRRQPSSAAVGPPGCGKTLLASRLPGLLPEANEPKRWRPRRSLGQRPRTGSDALAHAPIATRTTPPAQWPWSVAAPTAARRDLAGAQRRAVPGRIAGVGPPALEVLREPLESGAVTISRAARQSGISGAFPARRGDESLSLRLGRRSVRPLPLQPRTIAPLPRAHFGPAAGPHRPADRSPRVPPPDLRPMPRASGVRRYGCASKPRARQHARAGKANAHSTIRNHGGCRLAARDRPCWSARSNPAAVRTLHPPDPAGGAHDCRSRRQRGDLPPHLAEAMGYRRMERGDTRNAA